MKQSKRKNCAYRNREDMILRNISKDPKTGCWDWTMARSACGYGVITIRYGDKKASHRAHRLSFQIFNGEIPSGMLVCHHCDNKGCVNPDHLFTGTYQDNMDDMKSKNRQNRNIPHSVGVRNPKAKLTPEMVYEIRDGREYGVPAMKLAEKFGVSKSTIHAVASRRFWKHLPEVVEDND